MFCKICGCEIPEGTNFCPRCGSDVRTSEFVAQEENVNAAPAKFSGKAIAGFILSLVGIFISAIPCGILGIIFSVMGNKEIATSNKKGKGLAISGLIISIVDIVLGVYSVITMMGTLMYYM